MSRRTKQSERASAELKTARPVAPGQVSAPHSPASREAALFRRPVVRVAVSVVLLLHLLAVFIAPLAARPNASAISRFLVEWLRPYLDTAYLNHGYGFFSPDPGSSLLIRYEIELPDGTQKSGVLPDRAEHWPRLLYHRHFMLTSQSESLPDLPEAYARHLLRLHRGKRIKLELVEHIPAEAEAVLQGRRLTDPASYIVRNEATLDADGNFATRAAPPPTGEELPPETPIAPGGPTGERVPAAGLGPNEYRGPLAPRRLEPSP